MRNVLVTGATGFIGRPLSKLLADGAQVRAAVWREEPVVSLQEGIGRLLAIGPERHWHSLEHSSCCGTYAGIVEFIRNPIRSGFLVLISDYAYTPTRTTLMVDYSPSEFSRLRVQLAHDQSRQGISDNQFFVQYIMSLGAHGAHSY